MAKNVIEDSYVSLEEFLEDFLDENILFNEKLEELANLNVLA
jgi:hypothetical protein